jgi:hypothetical protein
MDSDDGSKSSSEDFCLSSDPSVVISEGKTPGAMVLKRMPRCDHSVDIRRFRCTVAPLLALYAKWLCERKKTSEAKKEEEERNGGVNRWCNRARNSRRRFGRCTYFCADLIKPEMDEMVITPVWYFS